MSAEQTTIIQDHEANVKEVIGDGDPGDSKANRERSRRKVHGAAPSAGSVAAVAPVGNLAADNVRPQADLGEATNSLVRRHWRFYQLAITDACNQQCPLCYAEATPEGKQFLSPAEFRAIAARIKRDGGKRVSLSGGEPTVHPQLPEIIQIARQEVGLAPILVTNGLRIADDLDYLLALKKAGLRRVQLQFDTLQDRTYEIIRGRQDAREKIRAINNVVAAEMRLGLICTVCQLNLEEVGELLDYAQTLGPALRIMVFQRAVPVGRFPSQMTPVTREDIIRALSRSDLRYELGPADFVPFPPLGHRQHRVHPDCSAHAILCVDDHGGRPLAWATTGKQSHLQDHEPAIGLLSSEVLPYTTLRRMRQIRSHGSTCHPLLVSVISFMCPESRNEDRLSRCIVATVTNRGFVGLCERSCNRENHLFPYR